MSAIELMAEEDMPAAGLVVCSERQGARLFRCGDRPIGVAARNLKTGEKVQWSPFHNTDDVLISGEPKALPVA